MSMPNGSTSLKKVLVNELEIGMFVHAVDRPLCETPFPLQGFYISSFKDIVDLDYYCQFVMIDLNKSTGVELLLGNQVGSPLMLVDM